MLLLRKNSDTKHVSRVKINAVRILSFSIFRAFMSAMLKFHPFFDKPDVLLSWQFPYVTLVVSVILKCLVLTRVLIITKKYSN